MNPERLVVGAAIVRHGRVMSAHRAGASLESGWEFPGGKVEPGEDPSAALSREIEEELGVGIEVGAFFSEVVALSGGWRLVVAPGAVVNGEPVPREHDAIRWLAAPDLDALSWLPGDRPFLGHVRELLR